MKKVKTIFLVLFISSLLNAQTITINDLPAGTYNKLEFNDDQKRNIETQSESFTHLPKVDKVNKLYPDGRLSSTTFWPAGSWGRGYHTKPKVNFYSKNADGYYFACHPLMRDVSCFLRGHLHLYLSGYTSGNSLTLTKNGIDYILAEQVKKGSDKGGFIWWKKRAGRKNLRMNPPVNKTHAYETAYALTALSEYYLSQIPYKRTEVFEAIQNASLNLINTDWDSKGVNNSNMKGLAIWSLASAYKVTADSSTLNKIKQLTNFLIDLQTTTDNDQNGVWLTGGIENINGYKIYHDTKIFYHLFILRGLSEVFSITAEGDSDFKNELAITIKRSVNHLINHRLDTTNVNAAHMKYAHKTIDEKTTPGWFVNEPEASEIPIETMVKLAYYSNGSDYFTTREKINLKNLANKISGGLNDLEKWHMCGIGYYINYMNTINNSIVPGRK